MALAAVRAALGGAARDPASLLLREAVEEANLRIRAAAEGDPAKAGMGATFTGALVRGDRVAIANVGDSRAYLLHGRRLDRLTEDHTLANDRIWGALSLTDRTRLASCRGRLTRALGIAEAVEVDVGLVAPQEGDVLLLCTDGLTAALSEKEIAGILLEHGEPEEAAARLMARATENGAEDDVTAVVVRWTAQGAGDGRA